MHRQAHVNKENEFSLAFFLWRYKGIKCVFTKNDESHLILVVTLELKDFLLVFGCVREKLGKFSFAILFSINCALPL